MDNDEITVNDGKGFYDNEGLIDTLILDLNSLTKALVSGDFVQYSGIVVQMFNKLKNLKTGIKIEKESLEEQVRDLRRFADELSQKAFGKDEVAENGYANIVKE